MPRGFRPDIQGLRAIAVLAVLLDHASVPFVGGGYVGVDVFFVISGFLITSQLVDRLTRDGRVGFADFYARRARRILPAALVVIALSVAGALIWMPPLLLPQALRDAIASALYVPNYVQAAQGTDYLTVASPSLFQHYWSLGVEEQFYLIWPALLGLLWAVARGRRFVLPVVLGLIVVGSLVACVVETSQDQPWAFFPLWTRAWELGAGGLLAVLAARAPVVLARVAGPVVGPVVAWSGLALIVVAAVTYSSATVFPGVAAVVPVLGAVLVIAGGSRAAPGGPVVLLGTPPAQFLGRISYSLYLVHWPILILAASAVGPYAALPDWAPPLLALGAVPVAWLLNRLVEEPARRPGFLVRRRPTASLLAAGLGTATVAALAATVLVITSLQPLDAGHAVQATRPTDPPTSTAVVPSNLEPSLQLAADDNPALYADGCQVGYTPSVPHPCFFGDAGAERVVLFGDSHAAQWFPALQKIAGHDDLQLETQTKSACPSVDAKLLWGGLPYVRCDRWRNAVIAQLLADPPDLVVLANYSNPDFADPRDAAEQWQRGLAATIAQLSPVTRVVVIADTPDLRDDPAVCLSAHLDSAQDCGRDASLALDSPGRDAERLATAETNTPLIDLTDYFCTDVCPAIIGNALVYRDSHHLTATFSAQLAGILGARLRPLL
ncbi:MAG TPA: acyltransferase family protein [Pseudolysinimonas sp.]|jgi:peptidoglycan/LPS O-acetylase OafA/YrhL